MRSFQINTQQSQGANLETNIQRKVGGGWLVPVTNYLCNRLLGHGEQAWPEGGLDVKQSLASLRQVPASLESGAC